MAPLVVASIPTSTRLSLQDDKARRVRVSSEALVLHGPTFPRVSYDLLSIFAYQDYTRFLTEWRCYCSLDHLTTVPSFATVSPFVPPCSILVHLGSLCSTCRPLHERSFIFLRESKATPSKESRCAFLPTPDNRNAVRPPPPPGRRNRVFDLVNCRRCSLTRLPDRSAEWYLEGSETQERSGRVSRP